MVAAATVDSMHGLDDPRLALAVALAREGGRLAVAAQGRVAVAWKGPGDRVTDADTAVQSHLVTGIGSAFPGDGVMAEEAPHARTADREFVWVVEVDPLDGTNNFALGVPCFAVSIGILRTGLAYAGVIHDPNTGFTCWARRGRGAFAGDRPLALPRHQLTEASNIAVRVPLEPRLKPLVYEWLERHKLRGFGSVALHLAYASIGALDVLLDHKAALWDFAAGAALLLESGGAITDRLGRPLFPVDPELYRGGPVPFVAGNAIAHAEAVARCRALLGAGDGRA
jgi:myo-inositol-1(or 4)-monophosphatase